MATQRQEKIGKVTSTKMQKTIVVTVERQIMHPLYRRVVRRSRKFMAHDEKSVCHVGDTVRIEETRPLSAQKRWRVVEVISAAAQVPAVAESAQ
jgi:small subunit ribosomal protein S17